MTRFNKRRLYVVSAILLVMVTAILFSLRDVVREVIVIPITYLVWVIGILIESTAQLFFWLAVLFIALLVAWRSIRPPKKPRDETIYRPLTSDETLSASGRGRVAFWLTRVNTLRLGNYYHANFNEAVSRMLVDMLAYRHHLTPRQVEQAISRGSISVPPDIVEFVRKNAGQRMFVQPSLLTWIMNALREWFLTRINREAAKTDDVLDPAVRRVIAYMEEELEVTNEQSGS